MPPQPITSTTCVVRNTGSTRGRTRSVTPETSATQHLHDGRIVLDAASAPLRVDPGAFETGLICLKGDASIAVEDSVHRLTPYDALYITRDTAFEVKPGPSGCDLAEVAAPVEHRYPVQHVSDANVQQDSGLHFAAGAEGSRREVNIVLGKNVKAGRIMAGVTFSQPGNWTSWLATARARGARRRSVSLHRHAGARLRHSARVHQLERSGAGDDRARG